MDSALQIGNEIGYVGEEESKKSSPQPGEYQVQYHLQPGAIRIVFEGSRTDRNSLCFPTYTGPCLKKFESRRKYLPTLVNPDLSQNDSLQLKRFKQHFDQQMALMKLNYNECAHGYLLATCTFGRVYMIDDPPEKEMSVADFHGWRQKIYDSQLRNKTDSRLFRAAFVDLEFMHQKLGQYLQEYGFQRSDPIRFYMHRWKIQDENKPRYFGNCYTVDGTLLDYCDETARWVDFRLHRAEEKNRDIRFRISSYKSREETTKRIQVVPGGEVVVLPEYIESCYALYLHECVKYEKDEKTVKLVKIKEYSEPDSQGYFTKKGSWREYVKLLFNFEKGTPPEDFPSELLEFCLGLENIEGNDNE